MTVARTRMVTTTTLRSIISSSRTLKLGWVGNAYSGLLVRIVINREGQTDLVCDQFISRSVHARLQVSVLRLRYTTLVNIQTDTQMSTHRPHFDQLIWKAHPAKLKCSLILLNVWYDRVAAIFLTCNDNITLCAQDFLQTFSQWATIGLYLKQHGQCKTDLTNFSILSLFF